MRNTVRWAQAGAIAMVGLIAGCGGGGGGNSAPSPSPSVTPSPIVEPTPTPIPTPSTTPTPRISASYTLGGGQPGDSRPPVTVTWEAPADIPASNIVEYHVFREDAIIGVSPPTQPVFVDAASLDSTPFSYNGINLDSSLLEIRTSQVPTFIAGIPHSYRVSVVFRQSFGVYRETAVGAPVTVNPPGM